MLGLDLTTEDDDVVSVMGDIYVKTLPALQRLLGELTKAGYTIDDLRKADYRKRDGVSVSVMEEEGWSLWFAKLPDIRYGVCGTCHQLISVVGIQSHGHKCEKCGAITYFELVDGSTINFVFNNDEERGFLSPQLLMKVKRWDTENGFLYLYDEFLEGGLSVVTGDVATRYMDRHVGEFHIVEEDGQKLIVFKYDLQWDSETAVIEPYNCSGSFRNYKVVKVWMGKQYAEYDRLPVPETISIFESWHWAPLPVTSTLHSRILRAAHQVDDQGWYHQDGRSWFTSGHWMEMAKFVRHFTQLDADAFDRVWTTFRSDGPGGIADIANFCSSNAVIRNEPNMFNTIIALDKGLHGQSLSVDEVAAARNGIADPNFKELYGPAIGKEVVIDGQRTDPSTPVEFVAVVSAIPVLKNNDLPIISFLKRFFDKK